MKPLHTLHLLASAGAALFMAACGGDDGGGINATAVGVTASSVGVPKYGEDLLITLEGRNLDRGYTFSAPGCRSFGLSSTEPYVSSASKAYFLCNQPAVGAQQVSFRRDSDGVMLATLPFSVPVPQVTLTVSNGAGVSGDLVITLEAARVRTTVDNFLAYVKSGFYVDTVFHRLVPGFIIQGGGYAKTLVPNGTLPTLKTTNAAIVLEDNAGLLNLRWTLAMARTSAVNSATSQFFVNLEDNPNLNRTATARGYAVFGTVTAGSELVTAMTAAPCQAWPDFFGSDPGACLPTPNLVVTAAVQTR